MCKVNITTILEEFIKIFLVFMHFFGLTHLRLFLCALFTLKSLQGIFHLKLEEKWKVKIEFQALFFSLSCGHVCKMVFFIYHFRTSLQEHFKGGPEKWNFVKGNWGKDEQTS